jgi:phosphoadenosine phosphosulfate reductase
MSQAVFSEEAVFSAEEAARWAERFESAPIEEVLEWAVERFAPEIVMTSSFGAEGVVLIDHLARLGLRVPVVYLDTGFHFPATEELKEALRGRYGLEVVTAQAGMSVAEQDRAHGPQLYARDADACCRIRKVEPLKQALAGRRAWLAALRRTQSATRALIRVVEWNAKHGLVKINPLATWTRADVWNYTVRHGLPYNRLYDEGYASIGCWPCTRPVAGGAHERSGRWDGEKKQECGIHL